MFIRLTTDWNYFFEKKDKNVLERLEKVLYLQTQ